MDGIRFAALAAPVALVFAALTCADCAAAAAAIDEFRVQREAVFEFAAKPRASIDGDRVTIVFETKGFCDVTVAIEDAQGKIVRHLASGVLGDNAPAPFEKDSKKQTFVWDGKDDQERYVDDIARYSVRVSLGLKPEFEKSLFWSPHKRTSEMPAIAAAPEGVYVYDGMGFDHVRLFDRAGSYVRTVYPFPADKLNEVAGLEWHDFAEGHRLPLKQSMYRQTLLTSGTNDNPNDREGMTGRAAMGMAVHGERLALAFEHVNRLATDGTTGGLPLKGPKTGVEITRGGFGGTDAGRTIVGPASLAFSPDGKTLYMTGWHWQQNPNYGRGRPGSLHCVLKMKFDSDDEPLVFAGSRKEEEHGTDDAHFRVPTSVAVDADGRVYVSDYLNDRVQIYDSDGTHLRTLATERPTRVLVHRKTGEIYVFSWGAIGIPYDLERLANFDSRERRNMRRTVTRFSPLPEGKNLGSEPFPLGPGHHGSIFAMGPIHTVELDSWADEPTFWVVGRKHIVSAADVRANTMAANSLESAELWKEGIRVIRRNAAGEWDVAFQFGEQVEKTVKRVQPPRNAIQQLYVNPATGLVYLGEPDSGPTWKAYKQLLEIDPVSGAIREVDLPFNALDVAFGPDGMLYLRTTDVVARYDLAKWRATENWHEVPWDYGEELPAVHSGLFGRIAAVSSGLVLPAGSPVCFHQGGISVSPTGKLIVACHNRNTGQNEQFRREETVFYGQPYAAQLYPGRVVSSTSCVLHVWDRHGKMEREDAVPGMPQIDGVFLDARDDIYVMATPAKTYDGQRHFDETSETLMKFRPRERGEAAPARIVVSNNTPIAMDPTSRAGEKPQLAGGQIGRGWVEGAAWMYGGVGFAGFNPPAPNCACWHGRFTVDYFGRSFAPVPYQFHVAVLDAAGNLMLRVGRYGNVDDGLPLASGRREPAGGIPRDDSNHREADDPRSPRSIGGDEIGLFHACFTGTHTDRRLFISDAGNGRIVSAKLGYHASETVHLAEARARAANE